MMTRTKKLGEIETLFILWICKIFSMKCKLFVEEQKTFTKKKNTIKPSILDFGRSEERKNERRVKKKWDCFFQEIISFVCPKHFCGDGHHSFLLFYICILGVVAYSFILNTLEPMKRQSNGQRKNSFVHGAQTGLRPCQEMVHKKKMSVRTDSHTKFQTLKNINFV